MSVSTFSFREATPWSAWAMRRLPSNEKGFVTTPTVRAPWSLATSAMMGAAPVPVPPPMPQVTNTMSDPASTAASCSLLSSAAFFPISGFAPAPRPLVSFSPICSFIGASDMRSA